MLKIVYAAGNSINSGIALSRFLAAIKNKSYHLKIATYLKSAPKNYHVDWTLDCLLDFHNLGRFLLDSDNFRIYYQQIKSFKPDLIISDLDYATSYIANDLRIPLWQCSSSLIIVATELPEKENINLSKYYQSIYYNSFKKSAYYKNLSNNSDYNFVYSHLGDTVKKINLIDGFEWIRPYYYLGKPSIPCQHQITAALIDNNKKALDVLKQYSDVVSFSERQEKYQKVQIKDINNTTEYVCNLKNSRLFVCQGESNYLADAFYNEKFAAIMPNLFDIETVINSFYAKYGETGLLFFDETFDLNMLYDHSAAINFNHKTKFLHQKIDELF